MENKEEFAKQALANFLNKHTAADSISCVDEIVLNYMVSILEELGCDGAAEDAFDIESFTEMMEAYLPGFAQINSVQVCEWMFSLANKLGSLENNCSSNFTSVAVLPDLSCSPKEAPPTANHSAVSETRAQRSQAAGRVRRQSRSKRTSSSSSQDAESVGSVEERSEPVGMDHQVQMLLEMFPASCTVEVAHFLTVANGDGEKAAELILARQEQEDDEAMTAVPKQVHQASAKKKVLSDVDDKQLKKQILQKYSYVDTQADKKDHKPVMPKKVPKKLVRYLDGQVVNTKGEKFTEQKKADTEEMKKTYVNLKPARQYRFH